MKLRFYCDIHLPLLNPHQFWATTNPGKQYGGTRLAFDVVVPDSLLFGPVTESPEVGKVEVVLDHSQEPSQAEPGVHK